MAEQEGAGREAQFHQLKKPDASQEGAIPRELDLPTARAILQTIVNTPESTITETTPLDQVAGYSVDQIRDAEKVVVQALMSEHSGKVRVRENEGRFRNLELYKQTPEGHLALTLENHEWPDHYERLTLSLNGDGYEISNVYPLTEPSEQDKKFGNIGFRVKLDEDEEVAMLHQLEHKYAPLSPEQKLEKLRVMTLGLRWTSANMLHWNEQNAILPDDLYTAPASSPQDKPQR